MISMLRVEVEHDSVVVPLDGVDYYTKSVNSRIVYLFGIAVYKKDYVDNLKLKVLKDSKVSGVGFIKK